MEIVMLERSDPSPALAVLVLVMTSVPGLTRIATVAVLDGAPGLPDEFVSTSW
jgi:hypothetical protein